MKVDTKIVPIEVKEGWFKKKQMQQLQYRIELTEVEKAIIEKAGLGEFPVQEKEIRTPEGECLEPVTVPIRAWFFPRVQYSIMNYNTLIEAQAETQNIKRNLTRLKELMDTHQNIGTEDSFEL